MGLGYKIKCENNNLAENVSSIFDNTNFFDVFASDVISAKHKIIIVSPAISKRTINKILRLFNSIIGKVVVITRPPEEYKNDIVRYRATECTELLKSCGIDVRFQSRIHQKFAVIDQKLIWYGSINLLSIGTSEESIIRIENAEIAEELLNAVLLN